VKGKGMQLGKKANTRLHDALSDEIAADMTPITPLTPSSSTPTEKTNTLISSEGIQIVFNETTSAKANRDGGLEAMDVQGQLNLHISDSTISRIQLYLVTDDADGTQFKTHPNVDRNLFKDHHAIGLRDLTRPFPLNQQMTLLRWRLQAKSEKTTLPISGSPFIWWLMVVNSWPSPVGDGSTDVSIEYEIDSTVSSLEDVVIIIPMPVYHSFFMFSDDSPGSIPNIKEIDGEYRITPEGFEWTPSLEIENGRLEFNVEGDDTEGFFPVEVRYKSVKPVCNVDVHLSEIRRLI
jgi:coatomer subunit delta